MAETKDYVPGTFCWIELMTSDPAAAKKFYGDILGWTGEDAPMPDGSSYTMLKLGGDDVGGLYQLGAEMKKMGVPPNWSAYVAVKDAGATAKQVAALGGKVVKDAFDVMDVGRMAVVQDPVGATFCLWQANKHKGMAHFAPDRVGKPCWFELLTPNVDRAIGFYGKLLGWKPEAMEMPGMKYNVLKLGEQPIGGAMEMNEQMRQMKVPPHWLVYFQVAKCEDTVARAQKLGARVLVPPMKVPTVGTFATLMDPQGAAFAVLAP
ncbi:MAG TPA: VOC family protein [Polyangia bacterium]|jgi:hypothetical protein